MKKVLFPATLLPALATWGMSEPASLPSELRSVPVVVVDSEGTTHELLGLRCEGRGELELRKGNVDYKLSLLSVRRIEVIGEDGEKIRLKVTMKGGKSGEFFVERSLKCSAESDIGEVSFYLGDVRTVEIGDEK